MRAYRAAWILPVHGPALRDGALLMEGTRVVDVGPAGALLPSVPEAEVRDLGRTIVLPGLVNAHTHLGLSHEGGGHPRGRGLVPWLMSLVPRARAVSGPEVAAAVRDGLGESRDCGTDLIGDIVSHPAAVEAFLADGAARARLFFEFLGVREEPARRSLERAWAQVDSLRASAAVASRLRPGLAPHAPYSVWPSLWAEVEARAAEDLPWTTHLAEDAGEAEFLTRGTGPFRDYLEWLGVWDGTFPPPGRPGVALLEDAGLLDERALLVHGVHLDEAEADRLCVNDVALCLCPRSNRTLGLAPPPVAMLFEREVFLCLGTDSRASNDDLSVWGEMREVRRIAPEIPAEAIVRMATAHGAMALGFAGDAGVLHPGREARPIAVDASDLTRSDPHEYLVEEPVEGRVRFLDLGPP